MERATRRIGYWVYDRGYMSGIEETHGAIAHQLMVMLFSNARHQSGEVTTADGGRVHVARGCVLFSVRTAAKRLGRGETETHRAWHSLLAAGEISIVELGRRLKRRKGTAPTIAKLTKYERFSSSTAAAADHFRTSLDTKVITYEEDSHLGAKFVLEVADGLGENQRAAEQVLASFETRIAASRRRTEALRLIEGVLATGYTAAGMIAAANKYLEACIPQGVDTTSMVPEHFYDWGWIRYRENCP